jgi:hypothetical protein
VSPLEGDDRSWEVWIAAAPGVHNSRIGKTETVGYRGSRYEIVNINFPAHVISLIT